MKGYLDGYVKGFVIGACIAFGAAVLIIPHMVNRDHTGFGVMLICLGLIGIVWRGPRK